MTKNEFIALQAEDIQTADNEMFKHILEWFKTEIPSDVNIAEDKSVSGLYDYMYEYAKKHQSNGVYCVESFDVFKKIAFEYLGINENETRKNFIDISLEDIFS